MPQLEQLYTFPSQIFWLLVTFGVLYVLSWKVLLPRVEKILRDRQERIDQDLIRAKELREKAAAALAEYEATVARTNAATQAIVRENLTKITIEQNKKEAELSEKLSAEASAAAARIEAAKVEAIAGIWPVVSETAEAAVDRLIGKSPTKTELSKAVDSLKGSAAS